MKFLEISHADLEVPFGSRFLYQAYLNLCRSAKKPDNLVIILSKDFLELQSSLKREQEIHQIALAEQKKLFDDQLKAVQDEFMKTLEQSPQIVPIPSIKK